MMAGPTPPRRSHLDLGKTADSEAFVMVTPQEAKKCLCGGREGTPRHDHGLGEGAER